MQLFRRLAKSVLFQKWNNAGEYPPGEYPLSSCLGEYPPAWVHLSVLVLAAAVLALELALALVVVLELAWWWSWWWWLWAWW